DWSSDVCSSDLVAARLLLEDALDVVIPRALATREFGRASFPIQQRLILGWCRMLAVRVGVIADGMLLQCLDHVGAMAALERTRLLTDNLKRCLNTLLGEECRQPFGRIIAFGQDVVFGVEPKEDVYLAAGRLLTDKARAQREHR